MAKIVGKLIFYYLQKKMGNGNNGDRFLFWTRLRECSVRYVPMHVITLYVYVVLQYDIIDMQMYLI